MSWWNPFKKKDKKIEDKLSVIELFPSLKPKRHRQIRLNFGIGEGSLAATIAAAIATYGTSTAGFGALVVAVQVGLMLAVSAISMGISMLLAKKPSSGGVLNNGRQFNTKSTDEPLHIIYGEAKVGCNWVYCEETYRQNKHLNIVGTWGEGEVEGYGKALDTQADYSRSSSGGFEGLNDLIIGGTFTGTSNIYIVRIDGAAGGGWLANVACLLDDYVNSSEPNGLIYKCTVPGTSGPTEPTWPTTVGNTVVDNEVTWICIDPVAEDLHDTFKWSDDDGDTWEATGVQIQEEQWHILNNDVKVKFHWQVGHSNLAKWRFFGGDGFWLGEKISDYYTKYQHLPSSGGTNLVLENVFHYGTATQVVDADLALIRPDWNDALRYTAYSWWKLLWNDYAWNSIPEIRALIKGLKTYDPRSPSVPLYHQNNALATLDFMTKERYGMGISITELDETSFSEAATWYEANGFTFNGAITTRQEFTQNLEDLLINGRAFIIWSGGKYKYKVYTDDAAVMAVTDDDFSLEEGVTINQPGIPESPTKVKCIFIDKNRGYGTNFAEYPDQSALVDDDERLLEIILIGTDTFLQAKRLAKYYYLRSKFGKTFNLVGRDRLFCLEAGDMVTLTSTYLGFTAVKVRVLSIGVPIEGLVPITFQEEDPSIYDLTVNTSEEQPVWVSPPGDKTADTPTGLTMVSTALDESTPKKTDAYAVLQWDWIAAGVDYILIYRKVGDTYWTEKTIHDPADDLTVVTTTVYGLASSEEYEWKVRSRQGKSFSEWASGANFTAYDPVPPTMTGVILTPTSAAGGISLGWTPTTDRVIEVDKYCIYRSLADVYPGDANFYATQPRTSNQFQDVNVAASTTYYYWINIYNTSGKYAVTPYGSVNATAAAAVPGADVTPPDVPIGLSLSTGVYTDADGSTYSWILAQWTANVEGDLASYTVRIKESGGEYTYVGGIIPEASPKQFFWRLRGGATYYVGVAAIDTSGNPTPLLNSDFCADEDQIAASEVVSFSKLVAGSIDSQLITLLSGTGDVAIRAGKTDFGDTTEGFIIGIDYGGGAVEKLTNGNMETWVDATNLSSWTEYGTQVNREAVEVHGGTYSCNITINAGGDSCWVRQTITLIAAHSNTLSFWYKNSEAGKTGAIRLADSTGTVYLKADGTWGAGDTWLDIDNKTDWFNFSLNFTTHASYTEYRLDLGGAAGMADSIIYYDDASVGDTTAGANIAKIEIGNAVSYAKWTGAAWETSGPIYSSLGIIGGFTIAGTTLTATNFILDSANQLLSLGSGNDIIIIDADHATHRLWIGHATAASAPFSVTKGGAVVCDSIDITGVGSTFISAWTTTTTALYLDGIDAAHSCGMETSDYPFYAGQTYAARATAPFRVSLAGSIAASSGIIGGATLGDTTLSGGITNIILDFGNKAISINSATFGQDGIQVQYNAGDPRLYAGDGANQYFKFDGTNISWKGTNTELTTAGQLTVSNIVASGGTVGGFVIKAASLGDNATDALSGIFLDKTNASIRVGATASGYLYFDGINKLQKSSNYVSGSAGYQIDYAGNSEFNNIDARGSFRCAVFSYNSIQAFNGSNYVVPATGKIYADFTSLGTPTVSGVELQVNGGMETGDPPTGWTAFGTGASIAQSGVQYHGGSKSCLVTVGSTYSGVIDTTISGLVIGRKYRVSAWVRGLDMVDGNFYLNFDGDIASVAVSNGAWVQLTADKIWTGTYNNYVSVYQSPLGSNGGKKFYVDDVSFQEIYDVFTVDIEDPDGITHAFAGGLWASGDNIRIKEPVGTGVQDLWATLSISPTDLSPLPAWRLTCIKKSPGFATDYTFTRGGAVLSYKQGSHEYGSILVSSSETVSPRMSLYTHSTTPWAGGDTDLYERVRIGNLNGYLGIVTNLYGLGAGNYVANQYLRYDPTNGLVIRGHLKADDIEAGTITGSTLQTASSGKRFVVSTATNEAYFYGDRGDGTIELLCTIGIAATGGDDVIIYAGSLNSLCTKGGILALSYDKAAIEGYAQSGIGLYGRAVTGTAIKGSSTGGGTAGYFSSSNGGWTCRVIAGASVTQGLTVEGGTVWGADIEGRVGVGVPNSAPTDGNINTSQCTFYLDEGNNKLKVRVKYSDNSLKTGEVTLT